ncbi:hypothetical protein EVAR_90027_1 [Eumeta japonica]|uniref:Uncharacterized protein n=1 Tax=Eumeta variegata TaxID=151549 RepID=A0A4C1WXE9_EUMVA|nr:hypothetical protein EVAR_90027_1 [Eumeta japonica]
MSQTVALLKRKLLKPMFSDGSTGVTIPGTRDTPTQSSKLPNSDIGSLASKPSPSILPDNDHLPHIPGSLLTDNRSTLTASLLRSDALSPNL